MSLRVVLVLSLINVLYCRPQFRSSIPNGFSVPNPCGTSVIWDPVGHYNPFHHTALKNKFANDFLLNGQSWASICKMDSDQDGKTNGEELGDPNCVWQVGQTLEGNAIGHPGICEPVGSPTCAYQKFRCDCLENCPGLVGYN